MRTTLKTIAKQAGVSTSLVSMHLNNHPLSARIASATKEKIDAVVKELNYRPSSTARALKSGRSQTLGLVIGMIAETYSSFYAQKLLEEALKHDYQLIISTSLYNQKAEQKCLENLINRQTDGIIYNLHLNPDTHLKNILASYPILQSFRGTSEYNIYNISHTSAFREAFKLLQQKGFKKTAMFSSGWHKHEFIIELEMVANEYDILLDSIESPSSFSDFEAMLKREKYDCIFSASSTIPIQYINLYKSGRLNTIPNFIYSYTLPCNYIKHESVLGVIVNPFKTLVEKRITRLIEMIEEAGSPIKHLTENAVFMNPDTIADYYQEQTEDPYYDIIINQNIRPW
jgi:DNA-binding LacI/PurR family transcriptional regulator